MSAPPDYAALCARLRKMPRCTYADCIDQNCIMPGQAADALEACANDSARYQWIRLRTGSVEAESWPSGVALDRSIDAAIAQQGEP